MVALFINLVQIIPRIWCQQPRPSATWPHTSSSPVFLGFLCAAHRNRAQRSVCTCLCPLERVRPWLDAESERPGGWGSSAWSKRPGCSLTWPQEELSVRRPTSPRAHTVSYRCYESEKTQITADGYTQDSCVVLPSKRTNSWFFTCFTPTYHDSSPHSLCWNASVFPTFLF